MVAVRRRWPAIARWIAAEVSDPVLIGPDAAGSAPPMCVAIHAVFADALADALIGAGARGIVTCDTIPHATNRICVADPLAVAVREQLA